LNDVADWLGVARRSDQKLARSGDLPGQSDYEELMDGFPFELHGRHARYGFVNWCPPLH
jgi:hypothetical protein